MLPALSKVSLFHDLCADELALLEAVFEPYACRRGTVIFEQGDPAEFMYLILSGEVQIQFKPYDGPAIIVAHVVPDGVCGWSAVVGNLTYTSGAVCEEDCDALRIRGEHLRKLCLEYPETGRIILDRLARVVSTRWKDAPAQVRAILTQGVLTGNRLKKTRP